MKDFYDFSKGRRGAVVQAAPGTEKISIRLDGDIVDWFRNSVDNAGGDNYQTLMNQALRDYIEGRNTTLPNPR